MAIMSEEIFGPILCIVKVARPLESSATTTGGGTSAAAEEVRKAVDEEPCTTEI